MLRRNHNLLPDPHGVKASKRKMKGKKIATPDERNSEESENLKAIIAIKEKEMEINVMRWKW